MKKQFLIISLGILFLSSCKTKIEKTIEGWWTIDTIYFKGYDLNGCLLGNSIEFGIHKQSLLPIAENYCEPIVRHGFDKYAKVEIIQSSIPTDTMPLSMKITSENEVFSGIHKFVFYKDEANKLLKMEIWSDSLYIVCRKGLFDFDKNINLINDLEKVSWSTRP